ncbi:MAG: oligosaccharide flippase family protein [Planctomycetota bacterium]|jgi:O-antigen/teichoic acid export membrane protein
MSLRKNIITTILVRVGRLFVGFAGMMIMARWLKPEGMGVLATFLAVPMMLVSLGELGVRQSIAFHVGQKKFTLREIAGAVTLLWFFSSILSIILVLVVFHYQGLFEHGVGVCLVGSGLIAAHLLTRYANGIALGKQWIGRINIAEACNVLARFALMVLLIVIFKFHVSGALWMEVIAVMAPGMLMIFWLRKDLQLSFKPRLFYGLLSSLFTHGFKFAIVLFVASLNYKVSILILQRFVSNGEIGQFSLGMRMAELIWLIPGAVGLVVFSHSTSVANSGDLTAKTAQIMRLTLLVCGFLAVGLGIFCRPFISIVFGSEYLPSVPLIRLMLPGCVAAIVLKVLYANLAGRGYPLAGIWVYLQVLVVNVACNLLLVPGHGTIGSAAASSVSYIFGAIAFMRVYARMSDISLAGLVCRPSSDWLALKSVFAEFQLQK